MEIKIAKKHCTYQENAYSCTYSIPLPKTSQYKGYTVTVPTHIVREHGAFYAIVNPWKDNFTFTLVKTEREEGKRYARPKLSFDELALELQEYDDVFDLSKMTRALAKFNDYDYNRYGVEEGRDTRFCVGYVKGKWFYEESHERHLISAKHFTLIKDGLTDKEVELFTDKIRCLNEWTYQIDYIKTHKSELIQGLHLLDRQLNAHRVTQATTDLIKAIDDERTTLEQAVKGIIAFLGGKTAEQEAQKEKN